MSSLNSSSEIPGMNFLLDSLSSVTFDQWMFLSLVSLYLLKSALAPTSAGTTPTQASQNNNTNNKVKKRLSKSEADIDLICSYETSNETALDEGVGDNGAGAVAVIKCSQSNDQLRQSNRKVSAEADNEFDIPAAVKKSSRYHNRKQSVIPAAAYKEYKQRLQMKENKKNADNDENAEGICTVDGNSSDPKCPKLYFTMGGSGSESDSSEESDSDEQDADVGPGRSLDVIPDESDELEGNEAAATPEPPKKPRPLTECIQIYKTSETGASVLTDEEVIALVKAKVIPPHQLEKSVEDLVRGIYIRRKMIGGDFGIFEKMNNINYENYDWSLVLQACCENVIGYIEIPLGVAEPLNLDGELLAVPMSTSEGCLVASTKRGFKALQETGIRTKVVGDGMTRGPVVRFSTSMKAAEAMLWLNEESSFEMLKESFDTSSRFARLLKIHARIAGRHLYIRFVAKTGDAMGMNMVSKGTEIALSRMKQVFPAMDILSLSGNFCTDKKPAAVNWIEGRGKHVVAEAIVSKKVIEEQLKTTVQDLIDLNYGKNLVGSAMAGSIGGFNAHAANIVTAIFLACGQDPAQNVGSSNCITLVEPYGTYGEDLLISCTMPSIEVGTVGGGTVLPAQACCLDMLGIKGAHETVPGQNAQKLARVVCASVLAGELSLMSALASGTLVKSHMTHNRSSTSIVDMLRKYSTNSMTSCASRTSVPAMAMGTSSCPPTPKAVPRRKAKSCYTAPSMDLLRVPRECCKS